MIFDGQNKLIKLETDENEIKVTDIYKKWKLWVSTGDNIRYPRVFKYVGGEKLPGDRQLGITFFLINGWKIKPAEKNYTLRIQGNLYTDDQTSPFVKTFGDYNVMVESSVSNIVDIVHNISYNNSNQPDYSTQTTTNTTIIKEVDSEEDDWSVAQ